MKFEQHAMATALDLSSYTIAGLTVMQIIPAISGILAILWFSLQIGNFVYTKFFKKD